MQNLMGIHSSLSDINMRLLQRHIKMNAVLRAYQSNFTVFFFNFHRCPTFPRPNLGPSSQTHGTESPTRKAPAPAHVLLQRVPAPCRAPQAPHPQAQVSPRRGHSLDHRGPFLQGLGQNLLGLWVAPLVLGQDLQPQAAEAPLVVKEGFGVRTAMLH